MERYININNTKLHESLVGYISNINQMCLAHIFMKNTKGKRRIMEEDG